MLACCDQHVANDSGIRGWYKSRHGGHLGLWGAHARLTDICRGPPSWRCVGACVHERKSFFNFIVQQRRRPQYQRSTAVHGLGQFSGNGGNLWE